MPATDSQMIQALNQQRNKLVRQLAAVEATKAMIALLEDQLKTATTKR